MAFEYFPAAAGQRQEEAPKPNWLALIAATLFLALCFAVGYIIWEKNKTITSLQDQKSNITGNEAAAPPFSEKDSLVKALTDATGRYLVLKEMNGAAGEMISHRDAEIAEKSSQIKALLQQSDAGQNEIAKAKQMISALNSDIDGLKIQVETLRNEKTTLQTEKETALGKTAVAEKKLDSAVTLIRQKDDIIDVATTLNASGFSISSIHEKSNGKERTTGVAKKVDKLRISFDIGENHVTHTGAEDLYVCITGPDGTPISVEALGSGKFNTRTGESKFYTEKITINYVQGNRQTVSFDWRQNSVFEPGIYKIEVFNNGFRIGSGFRFLK